MATTRARNSSLRARGSKPAPGFPYGPSDARPAPPFPYGPSNVRPAPGFPMARAMRGPHRRSHGPSDTSLDGRGAEITTPLAPWDTHMPGPNSGPGGIGGDYRYPTQQVDERLLPAGPVVAAAPATPLSPARPSSLGAVLSKAVAPVAAVPAASPQSSMFASIDRPNSSPTDRFRGGGTALDLSGLLGGLFGRGGGAPAAALQLPRLRARPRLRLARVGRAPPTWRASPSMRTAIRCRETAASVSSGGIDARVLEASVCARSTSNGVARPTRCRASVRRSVSSCAAEIARTVGQGYPQNLRLNQVAQDLQLTPQEQFPASSRQPRRSRRRHQPRRLAVHSPPDVHRARRANL